MVNYHLVDQAAVGGKNIVLKKLRNNLGRDELGEEIIQHREKLGELIIEGDHVDIVDFEFYGPIKMFINLQPVTVQNSELRVGDLLGVGNAVNVEEYRQMGGEAYNKTRLFKLEEYQPEDGGCISSDEENEDIFQADTDSCPSACDEARINDLDEIDNLDLNADRKTPEKVQVTSNLPNVENDSDASNSGSETIEIDDDDDFCASPEQIDAEYKGDPYNSDSLDEILPDSFRRQGEIPEENVIDLISDEEIFNEEGPESGIGESSSDPRSGSRSPEGEDLLTIQSDMQNPQFCRVDLAEYGIGSCLTPPSSRDGSMSHDEVPEKQEIPKKKQKRSKLKRPSRDSNSADDSNDEDKSDKNSRKRPKFKKHEETAGLTSSSDEQKTSDKEPVEQPNASPRIDPYRYSAAHQIARKALYTEPSESPYRSYKGYKAPPIIPKPQKKPPPSIKQMEQSTKGRFGPQKCTKTVAQMREERAKIQSMLQEKAASTSTTPKVKISETSRNDRILQEMLNTPSTSKQQPKEPQPGPSRL
ncbi:uncharacterized protein LOC134831222 isoform X2 [Culicoides brevitarsis]|uniref:uncharacterized protein LOC134831222 isoform X2 n=1 Tax=Culicoides brevitarsis TaxID=469753 RepID=UPI00307C93C6